MTEKRYKWCADGIDIWDNQKQERIDYDFPVLLNEQHEQIERLKRNFKALDEIKCELADENEQLKEDVKYFNETYFVQEYGLDTETHVQLSSPVPSRKELLKENEQLKKELFETSKELLWATSDEVDRALHYEEEVEELRKEIFE